MLFKSSIKSCVIYLEFPIRLKFIWLSTKNLINSSSTILYIVIRKSISFFDLFCTFSLLNHRSVKISISVSVNVYFSNSIHLWYHSKYHSCMVLLFSVARVLFQSGIIATCLG